MIKALTVYPLLPVDLLVVLLKFILGQAIIDKLRRSFNARDTVLSRIYWFLYSRY